MTFESYMQPVKTWLQSEIGADYWSTFQDSYDPEFTQFINGWIVEPGNRQSASGPKSEGDGRQPLGPVIRNRESSLSGQRQAHRNS